MQNNRWRLEKSEPNGQRVVGGGCFRFVRGVQLGRRLVRQMNRWNKDAGYVGPALGAFKCVFYASLGFYVSTQSSSCFARSSFLSMTTITMH